MKYYNSKKKDNDISIPENNYQLANDYSVK